MLFLLIEFPLMAVMYERAAQKKPTDFHITALVTNFILFPVIIVSQLNCALTRACSLKQKMLCIPLFVVLPIALIPILIFSSYNTSENRKFLWVIIVYVGIGSPFWLLLIYIGALRKTFFRTIFTGVLIGFLVPWAVVKPLVDLGYTEASVEIAEYFCAVVGMGIIIVTLVYACVQRQKYMKLHRLEHLLQDWTGFGMCVNSSGLVAGVCMLTYTLANLSIVNASRRAFVIAFVVVVSIVFFMFYVLNNLEVIRERQAQTFFSRMFSD